MASSYPSPLAFGLTHFGGAAAVECKRYEGCTVIWDFDVSGMDTSLEREESISWALAFIFSTMDIPPNIRTFIIDTIIERCVAMPDGRVYHVTSGLASGHGWTTMIETVWTAFLTYASLASILLPYLFDTQNVCDFLRQEVVIGVMGDDGRVGLRSAASSIIRWDDFKDKFHSYFLGRLRPAKCKVTEFVSGFTIGDYLPCFLGKTYRWDDWDLAVVLRPLEESIAIALWPERGVKYAQNSWNIAAGLLIDNRHPVWQSLVRRYIGWLEKEFEIEPGESWPRDVLSIVFNQFANSDPVTAVPTARILTDLELSELYQD